MGVRAFLFGNTTSLDRFVEREVPNPILQTRSHTMGDVKLFVGFWRPFPHPFRMGGDVLVTPHGVGHTPTSVDHSPLQDFSPP